jgi:hypothetical protein
MQNSWVGIHNCGGLIEAIPNNKSEIYKCSVHNCKNRLPQSEFYLIECEDLPENINPVSIKSMSRSKRKNIARQKSKVEAIELIEKYINEGHVNIF